jgi:hypothetical protein
MEGWDGMGWDGPGPEATWLLSELDKGWTSRVATDEVIPVGNISVF